MHQAIISYEFDGETRTIVSSTSTSWKPEIGKQCQVGIDPRDFSKARIYSRIPAVWAFLVGFGLTFFLVGISGEL